jgi:hypothetical protein
MRGDGSTRLWVADGGAVSRGKILAGGLTESSRMVLTASLSTSVKPMIESDCGVWMVNWRVFGEGCERRRGKVFDFRWRYVVLLGAGFTVVGVMVADRNSLRGALCGRKKRHHFPRPTPNLGH